MTQNKQCWFTSTIFIHFPLVEWTMSGWTMLKPFRPGRHTSSALPRLWSLWIFGSSRMRSIWQRRPGRNGGRAGDARGRPRGLARKGKFLSLFIDFCLGSNVDITYNNHKPPLTGNGFNRLYMFIPSMVMTGGWFMIVTVGPHMTSEGWNRWNLPRSDDRRMIEACWKCHGKFPALRSQQRGGIQLDIGDQEASDVSLAMEGFGWIWRRCSGSNSPRIQWWMIIGWANYWCISILSTDFMDLQLGMEASAILFREKPPETPLPPQELLREAGVEAMGKGSLTGHILSWDLNCKGLALLQYMAFSCFVTLRI